MNLLARAKSSTHLYIPSPSPRKYLLFTNHSTSLQQSNLYSTKTADSTQKTQQSSKPKTQKSSEPASSFSQRVKKQVEELTLWARPRDIPYQAKLTIQLYPAEVVCLLYKSFLSGTTMEDQKKRTLEALERRFAQAKEEFHAQQQNRKKRTIEDMNPVASNVERPPVDNVVIKPSFKALSRKGNISFFGHTPKQDVEVNEPAYFELSHPVNEELLPSSSQISDRKATVDHILHDLFQHGDSAQKYIQGSKSMRIDKTILLDNYVEKRGFSHRSRFQVHQKSSKRSKKHMSLKQHKKKGTFDLPEEFHNFKIFESMHEKWKSYISQLLKNVGKEQLAQCFFNADLHGATILVVQCKVVSYIGTHGIMIRETEQTFGIITQDNKFRVVPKKPSVFVLQADCWKVTLLGDSLASRRLVP